MTEETGREILDALRAIRDGQREVIAHVAAQRALAEEQMRKSRASIEESVRLQREALRRQRSLMLVAVPGIVACMAAIGYLLLRYF
jgi:hypothetical protein